MTAPGIDHYKFYILDPEAGENLVLNPQPYLSTNYFGFSGSTDVTVDDTYTRRGPACLKMNPVAITDCFVAAWGLDFTSGVSYTLSVDVLATAGESYKLYFATTDATQTATETFTATGYWQRPSLTYSSTASAGFFAGVQKVASVNTDGVWMDGWQVEASTSASSFIYGYEPVNQSYINDQREYWWSGLPYHSSSKRSVFTRHGGRIVDIADYAAVLGVFGLGMGPFEQIMTPMVSGGAFYQKHIRKPRNFGLRLQYTGTGLEEIQAKRAALLDMLRPDATPYDQPLVIRYQGFDVNGNEASHPVDIACVLQNCHTDPPNSPTHQDDLLLFTVMDGHLSGGYWEGAILDLYADFPAEHIVKRDKDGNWCKWTGSAYASLITGLNGQAYALAEAPDGKIYAGGSFTDAGGTTDADYLARWNPVTELWETVVSGISATVFALAFDANGDLYIGGSFENLGSTDGNYIVKITDIDGTPTVNALGIGTNDNVRSIAIAPDGGVYVGGEFTLAGGVANTTKIAKWDGTSWSALSTGLNNAVYTFAFAPNGDLYIGGQFSDTAYPYLCKWGVDANSFQVVGTNTDINANVYALAFGATGHLYVGGNFTNAGGNPDADRIASWNGASWSALGTGLNAGVICIIVDSGKVYVSGLFNTAGGLTLTDRVAVWSNGAWQPLDIDLPGTSSVLSILPASDGSLYIGGGFSTAGTAGTPNAETGVVVVNLNVSSASANVYPQMEIHGPGELRSIVNYSTNRSITFDGLTLQTGEYIDMWLDPANLRMKSSWSGRGSVLRYVNPGSDFGDFYLRPGENLISLFMPTTDANAGGYIKWKPKFWSIDGAAY